jgi:predicted nucleotidyltransferase
MLTPEDHIAALTKMIAAHAGVKRVILFGSRARGYATPRSDIDLAVDIADDQTWRVVDELVEEYPTLLKIDLVRLSDSYGEFQRAILESGKVLYEAA